MSLKVQVSWFPWLVFVAVVVNSIVKYSLLLSLENDLLLLFPILLAVLWMERRSIIVSLHTTVLGHPVFGFVLFIIGYCFFLAGGVSPSLVA